MSNAHNRTVQYSASACISMKQLELLLCRHYRSNCHIAPGVHMGLEFYTKDEVAARMHVSRRYLESRIAAGTGPETLHIGRRVLVRADALVRWVEELAQSQRQAAAVKVEAAPMLSSVPAACEAMSA